jgi:hypothetical protein
VKTLAGNSIVSARGSPDASSEASCANMRIAPETARTDAQIGVDSFGASDADGPVRSQCHASALFIVHAHGRGAEAVGNGLEIIGRNCGLVVLK